MASQHRFCRAMNVQFRNHLPSDAPVIEQLFRSVFTASAGVQEGAHVGDLARDLMAGTDARDLHGFVAVEAERIVGAIFFSRLRFRAALAVFLLAPVAVATECQGRGIGQALIRHGLEQLRQIGVQVAITYGDPDFYTKVGFAPLSPALIEPPLALSQPHGWLGQSLIGQPLAAIAGGSRCVPALDNPVYW